MKQCIYVTNSLYLRKFMFSNTSVRGGGGGMPKHERFNLTMTKLGPTGPGEERW